MSTSTFAGSRVLVTGASGFIGSHLSRRLRSDNMEVHAISRKTPSGADKSLHWWQGDLTQIETTRRLMKDINPDVIFHLASHVSGGRGLEHVLPTFQGNLMTTVNLLTVCSERACRRIVLCNSLEECDYSDPQCIPRSPYAAAKWASTGYAKMFHQLYQVPVVVLRVSMAYGPAQQDLNKLIPYVTLSLLRGEAPKLSSGQREVDWIYIGDVVEALLASAFTESLEGSILDIGSGEWVSIRGVVEHLARLCDARVVPLFGALADRPLDQVRKADIADAFARMGWKPRISLSEGLATTVRWYRERLHTV